MPVMVAVPAAMRRNDDTGSETNGDDKCKDCFFQDLHMFLLFEPIAAAKFNCFAVF